MAKSDEAKREPVHHVSHAEMGDFSTEAAPVGPGMNPPQTGGDIVARAMNSVATVDDMYEADAGKGLEGAKVTDFAVPFFVVLQTNSPQVDEQSGQAIEGARAGMLYNTVNGRLYDTRPPAPDGSRKATPATFIHCAFKQEWIRWGSRKAGGGFKGTLTDAEVAEMRQKGQLKEFQKKLVVPHENGGLDDKCDVVNDHRNHFGIMLNDDGSWSEGMISVTSTQIKKSKNIMAAMAEANWQRPDKTFFRPPSWAHKISIITQPESNDQGNWMGIVMTLNGKVDRKDLYEAGKACNAAFAKGTVQTNYADLARNQAQDDADSGTGAPSAAQPDKF